MTDSVKLWAFSETPMTECLVSGIGTLQAKVGARARIASRRALEVPLPPSAHLAGPPRLGEKVEHVGAAQQADHLAAPDHRDAPDSLADQKAGGLVDARLFSHRDHARAHDVPGGLPALGKHSRLRDDPRDMAFVRESRGAGDVLAREDARDLVDWCVLAKRDHVPRHDLF